MLDIGQFRGGIARHAPKRFFADQPNAIDNLIQKPPLPIENFRQDKFRQHHVAPKQGRIVSLSCSFAAELQKTGRR
jgi:hypothetical protein